ncbi:uncharacterized protein LOC128545506 [Clarias gariepinus]|uniref:uncharacterized protein LOC128545506 n=1 Tax=Clarias gariepinus TaxID=13013 RepID=UPI00234C8844|nr:uncharacterized protein LOC128545506 [Clarias gariepinus]
MNITTVCQQNYSEYQCNCADQYFWSFDNCIMYGACNNLSQGTCTCINAIPSDGQMCVPNNELLLFDYVVEFEVNSTSETVVNEVTNLFGESSFPLFINHTAEVTYVDITTVCQPYGIEYQCTCQDQYFWSLDNCAMYGTCNYSYEGKCTCINALPNDGQMCVPTSELPIFYYLVEFKINTENASVINEGRNFLGGVNLPFFFDQVAEITDVEMTTVCSLIGAEYHCWCEDQYFWPCEKCTIYGPCDDVNNSTCGCINGLPDDEQLCQPINELSYNSTCPPNPVRAEYLIEVEISTADFSFGYQLKYDLETSIFPFINFMKINMTTVCQLIGIEYQCTCQDQYFWSLDNCAMYGTCNYANENACTCINALPSDGQMCVPTSELPIFYYLVEFKINTENTSVINEGRNFLGGVNLPFFFGQVAEITDVEMTTVCSLIGAEYHCWCEDQYFWPCEKCTIYGPCDDVNNSTCGCINGLPDDEQLCQPINELSYNSTCPPNPVRAEYLIEVEISTADFSFGYQLKYDLETSIFPFINFMKINMTTVCQLIGIEYQCTCQDQYFWSLDTCAMYGTCNYANENACTCINALPSDGQMCVPTNELPVFYYLVEFEINTETASVIIEGRPFLGRVNLPFFFDQVAEITDVEMTTVCSLIGAEYHCWCEDQYFWPCEKCTIYGPCDDVNNSTCGCINGLPDDEQLCQPINELSYNSTCPPNPVRAEYLIEVEISTADFSFGYQLKYDLETSIFPFINFMKINMTTVCQLIGIEYQCTCQDQYFWSLDNCAMYGTCNYANENACTCINALPSDGQMCVPTSELPIFYYLVEFKINTENTSVINEGKNFLGGVNLPFFFGHVAEITDVEMTTVCSLIGAEYHCWCEDQYFWPCEKCTIYGNCDDVNNSTCGCINGLPDDEQLCQSINELSYNSTCPPNPVRAEYLIELEISGPDATIGSQLKYLLETSIFPFIHFTEINMTTGN